MDLNNISIEELKNSLLGTIFADGYISSLRTSGSKNGTNASFEVTHTSKNLDYLKLKKSLFEKIDGMKCTITEHNKKTEEKTYLLYRLYVNVHEWFFELRKNIYATNRIKLFPKEYIDKFNNLSLFFMYLDDGTLRVRFYEGTSRIRECRVTFCLDSFTFNEINYFREYLKTKYNIDSGVYRHTKSDDLNRGYRIWCNTTNTSKLMNLFDEFYDLVPSMKYKFVKYYSL